MTEDQVSKVIQLFWTYLEGWDWDTWISTSSSDREAIAVDAAADLGTSVDIDEIYDLFYDWSAGLTEDDFN